MSQKSLSKEANTRPPHLIEDFLEMLAAERGAAKNTTDAYRRDLEHFAAFLAANGKTLPGAVAVKLRTDVVLKEPSIRSSRASSVNRTANAPSA